jgi:hypothetical protein
MFGSGDDHFDVATDVGPLVALLYLVAVVGAIVVLGTRDPDDQPSLNLKEGSLTPRAYAPFPLIAVLGMIGSAGTEGLGIGSSEALFAPIFIAAAAAFVLYKNLPVIPTDLRRALMTPCILISSVIFNGIISDLFSEVRPADIADIVDTAGFGAAAMLFVFLPGVFYVMFVFAPRQLAETEGTWRQWFIRYGLYLGAALPGAALL